MRVAEESPLASDPQAEARADAVGGKGPSRRMVVWLVAAPVVLLALAFAGANWRTFHLAYCKNLMGSSDYRKRQRGLNKLVNVHFRRGISKEEVARLLLPLQLLESKHGQARGDFFARDHTLSGAVELTWTVSFHFDQREGLDGLIAGTYRRRVPREDDDSISVGSGGSVSVNPGADGRFRVHESWPPCR